MGLFIALSSLIIVEYLFESGFEFEFSEPIEFYDHSLMLHLIVLGISSSLGISYLAMRKERQKNFAEQMQKQAELKYLNAHINPHFIYNTLNGLYAQALEEQAEKTTEYILQLSELMRYPINNVNKKSISLKEEIIFIDNFINLQRLRLGESYPVIFKKTGNLNNIRQVIY